MTEIKLHTHGEKLIVSEKVTLASGNINSAELHVILDEAWAAYPNITASFETKEYVEPVDVLMTAKTATEYVCVIPAEVIQEQGTLEIAIRGVTNDGETAKTSTYAKYNIVRGASPGNITLKPTMDLYQQYLAAMDAKTASLFNAYKAQLDADLAAKYAELERHRQALSGIVLWENPALGNVKIFPAQTVDLDLTEYKKVLVVWQHCQNAIIHHVETIAHEKDKAYCAMAHIDLFRYYTMTNAGIQFDEPHEDELATNINKHVFRPVKIIGYKFD